MTNLSAGAVGRLQCPLEAASASGLKPERLGIAAIRHSGFVILSSLGIRHSSFQTSAKLQ
jgi:hypothetical protein